MTQEKEKPIEQNKDKKLFPSKSPESKKIIESKINLTNKIPFSSKDIKQSSKSPTGKSVLNIKASKGLNIIPIKSLMSKKENSNLSPTNTKQTSKEKILTTTTSRLSPKSKDIKLTTANLSPKSNVFSATIKNTGIPLDTSKYTSKIYANITSGMNKSPSPKPLDRNLVLKKSPDLKSKK